MRWIAGTMKKEAKMSGPEFHQTGYGRKFFEAQLPQLIKAIEDLAENVKNVNVVAYGASEIKVDAESIVPYIEREALKILNRALDKVE